MTSAQLRWYMHLGAIMSAIVANDYLPFTAAINGFCALAVWLIEGYIAERIFRERATT